MRITIKVGSNVLTRPDGTPDVTRLSALVDQVAELRKKGFEVILVSSGAVACGRSEVETSKKIDSVSCRQLYSAVGQAKLLYRYYELFREHGIVVGQVLTMKESFSTRQHYLNQKNCMSVMLAAGVIPIVNENDTISVSELMFTDNDELSGLVASMMDAEKLIILSNVDGIYDGAPNLPASNLIREIRPGDEVSSFIRPVRSKFGRGGMNTKADIARKVADEGIEVIIANGRRDNILNELMLHPDTTPCTRFIPARTPVSNVKKWIAHSEGFAKGELHVNARTASLLASDTALSILPVGIINIAGDFEKNDLVRIIDPEGKQIGVGKANCNAEQARQDMGKHGCRPVVHYDYLYIE